MPSGPIAVTLAYLLVYYLAIVNVLRVKAALAREHRARNEKFDRYGRDERMLAADRIQLNALEHMPPFLVLLWLDAVYVSAQHATVLGGAYVASRCVYPFLVGPRLGRMAPKSILFATVVGYAVLALFAGDLIATLAH